MRRSMTSRKGIETPPGLGVDAQELSIDAVQVEAKTRQHAATKRMRMARGMTIDSGAADNVMPRRMVRGVNNEVRSSAGSKAGVHYVAACNTRIPNEGECDFHVTTKDGTPEHYVFQIADVNKALCAVSYLVDHGHQVVFDQDPITGIDTSRIVHKRSGKTIPLKRERNVWMIDVYIEEETGRNDSKGFGRRG